MLRPFYNITIQQVTPFVTGGLSLKRDSVINLDFVTEYEIESGWENHTDRAKIKFPKNVILKSKQFLFRQSGTYNVILGGAGVIENNNNLPLIMRGDLVTIQDGYWFKNENGVDVQEGTTRFSGFVTKVESCVPIEIECEDYFYLLKRTPLNVSVWKSELISLCKYMIEQVNANFHDKNPIYPLLELSNVTDKVTADFSLGHLDIGNVTCAECLSRIRSQYHLESFFVGTELRFGFPIYDESKANSKNFFEFENTILEDNLEYTSKGDIVLSAVVDAVSIVKTGRVTRDNQEATKRSKNSILIYWDLVSETFKYHKKQKGQPFPKNEGGERRHFIYAINPNSPPPSDETLFEYGKKQLEKFYYTGFKGSFTTIGFPFVKWGDNVNLVSKVFADRNGQYKVKKVTYTGGIGGLKQEVCLDYKLEVPVPKSTRKIIMR